MIYILAYRPFVDPLEMVFHNLSDYWLLFVFPLLIAISIVYKTTKVADMRRLPAEATKMFVQIVVVMVLGAAAVSAVYWAMMRWA